MGCGGVCSTLGTLWVLAWWAWGAPVSHLVLKNSITASGDVAGPGRVRRALFAFLSEEDAYA